MSTLQKFKLLATQCAVAGSPTRSPAASPVIHLRRRKTLRMLLGRDGGSGGGRRVERGEISSPDRRGSSDEGRSPVKGTELSVRHKLKDLFVSSPPAFEGRVSENMREGFSQSGRGGGSGAGVRGNGARMLRPFTATFRQRLLRRAWRPVRRSVTCSNFLNGNRILVGRSGRTSFGERVGSCLLPGRFFCQLFLVTNCYHEKQWVYRVNGYFYTTCNHHQ